MLLSLCLIRVGIKPSMTTSEHIDGAANSGRPAVEDVGVNHGSLHVLVAKELLDCSNIVTAFQ